MAAAFEASYGTPPASGYKRLPFVSSALGDEQNLIASDLLGYGREPQPPSHDVINNEGDVVVPVDLRNFGYWLKLLLGAPTSVDNSGVFTHTFVSSALVLPSMAIEIGMPEVPSYGMNFGLRANTMKLQLQQSGLLNATMNFTRHVDKAMVKAIARAFHWRDMLESGKYTTIREIAAEKINETYVSRVLRLTLLATDIVETIL